VTHERSSGPSHHRRFCCPVSSSGTSGRLRPPPGPQIHFPAQHRL
jgi:hypothetical protein